MSSRGNTLQRGDLAEVLFIAQAMRRGHDVSKPCTLNLPYDLVIGGASRRLKRVQIKSVWTSGGPGAYRINCHTAGNCAYTHKDIDILAAYVAPEDAWYIIPIKALGSNTSLSVLPHTPRHDTRWGRYREAWRLLGRPRTAPAPETGSESLAVLRNKLLRQLAIGRL